jgi:hypothetical protein
MSNLIVKALYYFQKQESEFLHMRIHYFNFKKEGIKA